MTLTEYDEDIPLFYVEVDYIIVVRHHVMSQQQFSSNYRQLCIAITGPSMAGCSILTQYAPKIGRLQQHPVGGRMCLGHA
jgi:hypothetical protein